MYYNETDLFLKQLDDSCFGKKYALLYSEPILKKYKIMTASFIIQFEDDFLLKVLKKNNVYDFTFIPFSKKDKQTFGESRDFNVSLFSILCKKYSDIDFDLATYYPQNFENTNTFRMFYEYYDDRKGSRHYGVKPYALIYFIQNNYQFICDMLKYPDCFD